MTLRNSFDIVDPADGPMAINSLLWAMSKGGEATITLRSTDDGVLFALVVREVKLEKDKSTGIFLLDAEADLGRVTGRLWATSPADQPVGRLTILSEGAM